MTAIKKHWQFYLYLLAIFCLSLLINRFSAHRLPAGEDDLFYFGTIKRFFEYQSGNLNVWNMIRNPQEKMLLFYLLFYPWQWLKNSISILNYYNLLHLLFYLGGFFSFYRLSKLNNSKFSRYLLPLFYVLIISNTFWLGPRYFEPAFWLYIAIPNVVYAGLKKRYLEGAVWVALTYFFYVFGFALAFLTLSICLLLVNLKPVWLKLVASIIIFGLFYFIGLTYVGNFIHQINSQAIIPQDLRVLNFLNIGLLVFLVVSLVSSLLKKRAIYWDGIFIVLLMFFIFYTIVSFFPNEAPSYRLVIMLYVSYAVAISSFLDILALNEGHDESMALNQYLPYQSSLPKKPARSIFRGLPLFVLVLVGIGGVWLLLTNLSQVNKDSKRSSVLPQEVSLFSEINSRCQTETCLVVSDPGTMLVGSYFSSVFGAYNAENLSSALESPQTFHDSYPTYDQIFLIVSKRTTDTFHGLAANQSFSRSYLREAADPLSTYKSLRNLQSWQFYQDTADGLYAYQLQ